MNPEKRVAEMPIEILRASVQWIESKGYECE